MRTALEVHQRYFDTTLTAGHHRDGTVRLGSRVGWRWTFLGVDMGHVPSGLRHVLPWLPPVWSDVSAEPLTDLQGSDLDDHALFAHDGESWTCDVPPGWTATLDGAPADGEIPVTGELVLTRGDVSVHARIVEAPPAPVRKATAPDFPLLGTLSTLGMAAAMFGLAVSFAPPRPEISIDEIGERVAEVAIQIPTPPPPAPTTTPTTDGGGGGAPSSTPAPSTASGPRTDREIAQSAGLFASPGLLGDLSADLDLTAAADSLQASAFGRGPAIGSLAGRGNSLGGGGGVGGIGDIGGPGGPGGRPGFAYGGPGIGGTKGRGRIGGGVAGEPILIGNLERSEIDRVVKSHLASIRYCYQRRLQQDPTLGGKVVVKFVVAKDGSVSKAEVKSSSIADAAVGSCITTQFRRMSFPAPRGGGMAIVSYPFLFAPG
ncbi:MAG: AgmX/PglI C-terminal domain-containing protein [Alphaproteobacteria bacterium]|nr:AgmX/PglI C-terminal domain-containing protein [Alphaproteobacteria bacterium]